MSTWSSSMLFRRILDPTHACHTTCKICFGIQSGELTGYVWVLRLDRANKSRKTSCFQRATSFLSRVFRQLGPNLVFLPRSKILHWFTNWRDHPSYRTCFICSGLLPWWDCNATCWWSGCIAGRGEPPAYITTSDLFRELFMIQKIISVYNFYNG